VHDALNLRALNRTFNTVLDSGLLHCFRTRTASAMSMNWRGAESRRKIHVMVFSEKETRPGPGA
jgi:hypothetical protein